MDDDDRRQQMALCRYQAISAYIALEPAHGKRGALLEQLARKTWRGPDGEPLQARAETLRSWVRRYGRDGLPGLMDKQRARRGVEILSPEQLSIAIALKTEVPERSLDRLIRIAEQTKKIEPGLLRRSTVHRVLQREGISGRPTAAPRKPTHVTLDLIHKPRFANAIDRGRKDEVALEHDDLLVAPLMGGDRRSSWRYRRYVANIGALPRACRSIGPSAT